MIASLGQGPAIAVGYSMGGLVASLLALDHPAAVAGVVLVASGPSLTSGPVEKSVLKGLGLLGDIARRSQRISDVVEHSVNSHIGDRVTDLGGTRESGQRSVLPILDAGKEIGRKPTSQTDSARSRSPVGLLVTTKDHTVDPMSQLHTSWTGADVIVRIVEGGHDMCVTNPQALGVELHGLIEEVAWRAHAAKRARDSVEEELRRMSGRAQDN